MNSKLVVEPLLNTSLSSEAKALLARRSKAGIKTGRAIQRQAEHFSAPLAPAQEMLWLSAQINQSTSAFNRCSAMRIKGHVDREALQKALSEIVQRHAILRSHVNVDTGTPVLQVNDAWQLHLLTIDLSHIPAENRAESTDELLAVEARTPFHLDAGPWIRAGLLIEDEETSTLYISTHHIASDGWSDAVMFRELHDLYAAFKTGRPSPLAPLPLQYSDFAAWQQERGEDPKVVAAIGYWNDRMAGAPATQDLPVDRARAGLPDMSAGQVKQVLGRHVAEALAATGRKQGATTAMTILAAFQAFQFRITGQADSVVGLSMTGRTTSEVDGMIGLFNTVLPLRVTVDRTMSFSSLLGIVRTAVIEAQTHQDLPGSAIMSSLPSEHGARQKEISQTLFNFRNMPEFKPSLPGLDVEVVEVFNGGAVADLQLEVVEESDGIEFALRFRTDLFDEGTASRLLGNYTTLLKAIAVAPDQAVGRLDILSEGEREQLLVDFNGPVRAFAPPTCIDQLFSEQAARTPDATAISFESGSISYRQLEVSSNSLARELQARGIVPGDFVAVCMDRSPQSIVSLIAILKAGAAFVPLDTEYPPERLAHMLADTQPTLLLADTNGDALLSSHGVEVFLIDESRLDARDAGEPPVSVDRPDDAVACVLYTSGSTGLPKGVLSTHRGIVNNFRAMQEMYGLAATDCMLHQTSLGFDAAAWEIFWPLSVGARTYVARPGGQRDAEYIAGVIAAERVATVGFAPSMLKVMLRMPTFTGNADIRRVMSYGEVLPPAVVKALYAEMPSVEIVNLYGPTEAAIVVTSWRCERQTNSRSIPIGKPLANTEVYILDADLQPVPVGVKGEIYIGGVCLANGYHNRADLSAGRFLPHPFREQSADRVYRTGDVAKFAVDGVIEYVGRQDHQLKVRGVRVELEEIEAALCKLPGVRESVVIVTRDSDDEARLIAYIAVDSQVGTPVELRRALEKRLPPQFLPAQIICLDELPHSINGKIDRGQLPDPALVEVTPSSVEAEQPETSTEVWLIDVWKDLLQARDVEVCDSFFDLGGHSLLAVRMLQRVADELGATVSLRSFYEEPTVKATARLITGERDGVARHQTPPLLKVRESAAGLPPIFYLNGQPPGGGRYARRFAPFLPADQGLYIMSVPIFETPVTVEEVAAPMTQLIRSHQPSGPYLLGGNCFGATLSLEIAQQLVQQGERVSLLVLVHPDARAPMHLGFRAMRRLALLGGLGEDVHFAQFSGAFDYALTALKAIINEQRSSTRLQRIERLTGAARWLKEFTLKNVRKPATVWSALRIRGPREADIVIQEQLRWGTDIMPNINDCGDQTANSEIAAHAHYMSEAWTSYNPRPYNGPVAIVWPVEGPANPPWNPRALWSRLTPDLDWHLVPGNHWTMLHHEFDHSARALGKAIERARSPR